jgi:hypothetical protein
MVEVILYEDEEEKNTYKINPISETIIFIEYEKVAKETYGYTWLENSRYSLSFKHIRQTAEAISKH